MAENAQRLLGDTFFEFVLLYAAHMPLSSETTRHPAAARKKTCVSENWCIKKNSCMVTLTVKPKR